MARKSAANDLMAVGNSLAIPTLAGIPVVHRYSAGDHAAIELSRTLVKLDIGVPEDWERATHDPENSSRSQCRDGLKVMGARRSGDGLGWRRR
jgi:hypothetical protein